MASPPKKDTIPVTCPKCGHVQPEPRSAYSTLCKQCGQHFRLQEALHPAVKPQKLAFEQKQVICFQCRAELQVAVAAESTMCKKCSSHVDLRAVVKGRFIGKLVAERTLEIHSTANIKGTFSTGRLIVPAGNHFRWAEALRVGAAEIGGELVANLQSAGTVMLKSTARFFGDVRAGNLVVESGAVFVGAARIGRLA